MINPRMVKCRYIYFNLLLITLLSVNFSELKELLTTIEFESVLKNFNFEISHFRLRLVTNHFRYLALNLKFSYNLLRSSQLDISLRRYSWLHLIIQTKICPPVRKTLERTRTSTNTGWEYNVPALCARRHYITEKPTMMGARSSNAIQTVNERCRFFVHLCVRRPRYV